MEDYYAFKSKISNFSEKEVIDFINLIIEQKQENFSSFLSILFIETPSSQLKNSLAMAIMYLKQKDGIRIICKEIEKYSKDSNDIGT